MAKGDVAGGSWVGGVEVVGGSFLDMVVARYVEGMVTMSRSLRTS